MLSYSFEDTGGDSLYDYLYKCIKTDILKGNLQADEKLPSKRMLAAHLGVSVITVENAYSQLLAEGYIYSKARSGYYVSPIGLAPKAQMDTAAPAEEDDDQGPAYFADFLASGADADAFPFRIWLKTSQQVMRDKKDELLKKPDAGGCMILRQQISRHLADFRGLKVSPRQIIIGSGTEYLYGLLVRFFGADTVVCLEDPGYPKIEKIYMSNGARCVHAGIDRDGIRISELRDADASLVHVSPSHQFPTGIAMPARRRYELLSWASEDSSRYIIEDDYDSEFRFSGRPLPSLASMDAGGRVIYINTFSKSLCPTLRLSYMVLPKPLLKQFYDKLGFLSCTVSNFEQLTLAEFIEDGHFERHLNRMRVYYRRKRKCFFDAIRGCRAAQRMHIIEEGAGLHFLLRIDTSLPDSEMKKILARHGIHIASISDYYVKKKPEMEHVFIVNYSAIDSSRIEEAADRIAQSIEEAQETASQRDCAG